MKKFTTILGVMVLFIVSCQKELKNIPVNNEQVMQPRPYCGTMETMAKVSPAYRIAQSEATMVQAPSLLVYLDFDGASLRPGLPNGTGTNSTIISGTRNCPAAPLTAAQIADVVKFVEDDFSPFKIVVTTDREAFDLFPLPYKHICIITTTPGTIGQQSGVGGVAPFLGPGIRIPYGDPSFVFATPYGSDLRDIALTVCQEVAHTLGLEHQHHYIEDCVIAFEYHPGFGTGPLSFSPIMGAAFNKRITGWWGQPCEEQDDFEAIVSVVAQKEDDFPDSPAGHTALLSGPVNGILEKQNDVDYILLGSRSPGSIIVTSENIDLKASLVTPGGHIQEEYNDPGDTHVTIPVARGRSFLKIEGVSNVNLEAKYMTGKYKVTF